MATYNGAAFVEHQVHSILSELRADDELIVVDDASTDGTPERVEAIGDGRIRVVRNPRNLGYVRTFEAAMALSDGDVVLLADQDDEWVTGRRDVLAAAAASTGIAASNLVILGTEEPLRSPVTGRPWRLRAKSSRHALRNELRILVGDAPYFGCAMAVRRDVLPLVTPFPAFLTESHDLWMATVGNAARSLQHVEETTLRRRLHESNASSPRPRGVRSAVASRVMLVRAWFEARRRVRAAR
ncbi:glycosyltransferase [Microbacterium sp. CFBP9034]|uniref:glycosyltransferase n=1 Tax=Microbacterium sp. CFBP9034 TaxID=3096540 RepID=UPI0039C959D4